METDSPPSSVGPADERPGKPKRPRGRPPKVLKLAGAALANAVMLDHQRASSVDRAAERAVASAAAAAARSPSTSTSTNGNPFDNGVGSSSLKRSVRGNSAYERAASTSSGASSAPGTPQPQLQQGPFDPLAEEEYAAFGVASVDDALPLPPKEDGPAAAVPSAAVRKLLDHAGHPGNSAPMGRAKRPKNVKFSPAKGGKALARRAMASSSAPKANADSEADASLPNNDYCDACNGKGHFLCCDGGCLRSFHFNCLEPPLDIDDVPDEDWYCKSCRAARSPPPKATKGYFRELIYRVDTENPKAFNLTPEIKNFYKNVATGSSGEFIDSTEHRPPSKITGRAIGQEDRDGYRLKDKLGHTILCYRCHTSASIQKQKRIISCDFCEQHWHLDCLDPPMTGMPPPARKWMCPIHAEMVLAKKRYPKQATTINVVETGTPNNGNIIVMPRVEIPKVIEDYDEITVNRVRYQVPEETIILDFWGRVQEGSKSHYGRSPQKRHTYSASYPQLALSTNRQRAASPSDSMGSPLTSLGDLSDSEGMVDAVMPDTTLSPFNQDYRGLNALFFAIENAVAAAEGEESGDGDVEMSAGSVEGDQARGSSFTAEEKGKGKAVEASSVPSEVEVTSESDLQALTRVRTLLAGTTLSDADRRALLGFIDGAAVHPKVAPTNSAASDPELVNPSSTNSPIPSANSPQQIATPAPFATTPIPDHDVPTPPAPPQAPPQAPHKPPAPFAVGEPIDLTIIPSPALNPTVASPSPHYFAFPTPITTTTGILPPVDPFSVPAPAANGRAEWDPTQLPLEELSQPIEVAALGAGIGGLEPGAEVIAPAQVGEPEWWEE